ncbi:hypothetical protein D3C75_310230 [compost metagenome]
MTWSVLNISDQASVGTVSRVWTQFIEQRAQCMDDFDILLFVMTTNVVSLTDDAFGHNFVECTGMVFDIEPVTNLIAFAIDRQGLAFQSIENDQRDQFFRKMARAVIVRAVGDQGWQTVSAAPGTDQVIGTGLAGRVRRAWLIGCSFSE